MRRLCHAHRPGAEKNEEWRPSNVALYPFPLRCIVACHCHRCHVGTVQSHSGPRRSIILSLLPSDQHALPSRSVAGLPVLLRIGCDAQLACASRLSHFTLLGNDPTLRGLHPLYLTPLPNGPFPWCPPDCYRCQRTPTGHATLGGEIAPALTTFATISKLAPASAATAA